MRSRSIHAAVATASLLPLVLTVVSGTAYRVLRAWFDAPKESVHWLLDVHQMSALGLESVYPVVVGAAALAMVWTGASMLRVSAYAWRFAKRVRVIFAGAPAGGAAGAVADDDPGMLLPSLWPAVWSVRSAHRLAVWACLVPATITIGSGMAYAVVRYWLPHSVDTDARVWSRFLMGLHQGSWTYVLSPRSFVPLLGTGLCVVLVTGARMSRLCRASPAADSGTGNGAGAGGHHYAPVSRDDDNAVTAAGHSQIDSPDDAHDAHDATPAARS